MKKLIILLILNNLFGIDYGRIYFEGNCIMCHHIKKDISAPSIIKVKKAYLNAFKNKNDFINYMSNWVVNPNQDTSIMQLEIKKYNLMPKLGFEKSTIEIIAKYIYETNFNNYK